MTKTLPFLFPELFTVDALSRNAAPSFDVDVYVKDDAYHLNAALPGYEKDSISISTENRTLTIKAEGYKSEENEYIIYEIPKHKDLERSFKLADDIDEDNITANFKNGILSLKVNKLESKKSRDIKIK
jgi:HSP20 family protein